MRQLGLVEDLLAHEIGERDFGGGDEPEPMLVFSDCDLAST